MAHSVEIKTPRRALYAPPAGLLVMLWPLNFWPPKLNTCGIKTNNTVYDSVQC